MPAAKRVIDRSEHYFYESRANENGPTLMWARSVNRPSVQSLEIELPKLYRSPASYVRWNDLLLYRNMFLCAGLAVPWKKIEKPISRSCAPAMKYGDTPVRSSVMYDCTAL